MALVEESAVACDEAVCSDVCLDVTDERDDELSAANCG